MQLEAEKLRGPAARQYHRLAGVKPQSSTHKITLDPQPPLGQYSGVIVEKRKVIDVAQIGRAQHLGYEMIEPVEIEVGKKLTGQVADRQPASALERREEVIAIEINANRFLRI